MSNLGLGYNLVLLVWKEFFFLKKAYRGLTPAPSVGYKTTHSKRKLI